MSQVDPLLKVNILYNSLTSTINTMMVWQDFGNDSLAAVRSLLFLVEFRDSESLTLEMSKVPEIRKWAKELGVVLPKGIKKAEMIDKLVLFQCCWF